MTEVVSHFRSRRQSVVDELWNRARNLVENYDGDMFGSAIRCNMALRILEDDLMTPEEFQSVIYDDDLEQIHDYMFEQTRKHSKSPYRYDD